MAASKYSAATLLFTPCVPNNLGKHISNAFDTGGVSLHTFFLWQIHLFLGYNT